MLHTMFFFNWLPISVPNAQNEALLREILEVLFQNARPPL